MPIRRRMGMESSPIPGEDKLLLWDQAAFERRKDSDQEKELLKEDLVVEMPVFAGEKTARSRRQKTETQQSIRRKLAVGGKLSSRRDSKEGNSMGFLKSLFGGKNDGPRVTVQPQTKVVREEEAPVKKVAASVQDLVLLSLAESYKVGEMKYPDYFRTRFGIGFPNETFQKLEKRKNW